MIWILLTFLACSEQPIVCEGLDEQACEEAEACVPIGGRPIHGDYDCEDAGPREYAGCASVLAPNEELVCSDIEVYRHPPGAPGECWQFGSACAPDGWGGCEACPN